MRLPALLYGSYPDVKKRCHKAIDHSTGDPRMLWHMLQIDGMLDTADHAGAIIIEALLKGSGNNFHCYAPLYFLLRDDTFYQLSSEAKETLFTAGLEEPWSLTCMLSRQLMHSWLQDVDHYRRYILAILRHWDLLDAEGDRYAWASDDGERLWAIPTAIQSALVKLGVPLGLVQQPLPRGGLYALLAVADRTQAGDLVALGQTHASSRTDAPAVPIRRRPSVKAPPEGTYMSGRMKAAVEANDPVAVQRLIEAGEPIRAIHESRLCSPLNWAAENGHTELARFLLDHGAAIEDRADEGESPLMLAARGGHHDMVRLLLDRGADPYYVTDKGFDVLHFAKRGKNAGVITLLKHISAGQDPDRHLVEHLDR